MMTPEQKRAAVLAAAEELAAHPEYFCDRRVIFSGDEPRCLLSHVTGPEPDKPGRLAAAGFTVHEMSRLLMVDSECTARAMLREARKLCNELWPVKR